MRQTPTLGYLKSRNKLVSMLGKRGLPNPDLMATEHALDNPRRLQDWHLREMSSCKHPQALWRVVEVRKSLD
jgi:hypothetical protein